MKMSLEILLGIIVHLELKVKLSSLYRRSPHSTINCINPLAEMSSSADDYQLASQKLWPFLIKFT